MECGLSIRQVLVAVIFVLICSAVQAQQNDLNNFSLLPKNLTARPTFPARFDCQTNITDAFIRWARGTDYQMIGPNVCSNCTRLSNGSLSFQSIDQSHGGRYTCIILANGGSIQYRANVYLTVAEKPSIVILTPAGKMFTEGGNLQISVQVTGEPQPNITWQRGGVDIDEREDPRVTITGANLTLSNVQPNDAGEYKITAVNIADTVEKCYNVIVHFVPVITISRSPDSEMVEDGVMVTVTCSAVSHTQSTIRWEQITASSERRNKTSGATIDHPSGDFNTTSTSSITFTSDDINGYSKFCCTAINDVGMYTKCLNFTETGTPVAPANFNYTMITSTTVTVSWQSSYTMNISNIKYILSWYTMGTLVNSERLSSNNESYTIENLVPDTEYVLTINTRNTDNAKESHATSITVRTPIAVPGVVENFAVEVIGEDKIFRLTWQAPEASQVEHYVIYWRVMDRKMNLTIPGNHMSYNYTFDQENVVYEFAVQAVNSRGSSMSNYMAVFYCSTNPSLAVSHERSTHYVNVSWTRTSRFSYTDIYLIVTRKGGSAKFTTRVMDGKLSQCIGNLDPSTDYSITVLAIFNCGNVSKPIDFRTLSSSGSSDGGPSRQDCIEYDPETQEGNEPEGTSDSGLETWIIAVIVTVPIVAFVVMLSIGIMCALQRKQSYKNHGELPAVNNATSYRTQQEQVQLVNNYPRNNSTSTYTNGSTSDYRSDYRSGSVSPTRSALSYNSRPGVWPPYRNPSIDVGSTIDENSSVATSV